MSDWSIVGLIFAAIAVPFLLLLLYLPAIRMESKAATDIEKGVSPTYVVGKPTSFFLAGFFAVVGVYLLYGATQHEGGRWGLAALAVLFFVKSAYYHLVFRSSRVPVDSDSKFHLLPIHWRTLAAGAATSAALGVYSGAAGEGVSGWFLAFFMLWLAGFYLWAAKRAQAGAA